MYFLIKILKKFSICFQISWYFIFKKFYLLIVLVYNQLHELHKKYYYSSRAYDEFENNFYNIMMYGTYENREDVNTSVLDYILSLYEKNLRMKEPLSESTFLNLLWRHFEGLGHIQELLRGFNSIKNLIKFLDPLEN